MERNRKIEIKVVQEEIRKLPEELQKAIIWAINNWELVKCLCNDPEMTYEDIEKLKVSAIGKTDYLLFVLACAAQVFKNSDETIKQ